MRLNRLPLAGAAVLLAIGLAACDGSENARTIPTSPPGYQSPALIGPEVPEAEEGEGDAEYESEGTDPNAGENEDGTAATAEAQ